MFLLDNQEKKSLRLCAPACKASLLAGRSARDTHIILSTLAAFSNQD